MSAFPDLLVSKFGQIFIRPKDVESPKLLGMIYIGISGWTYKGWRGVFYPKKLPQKRELEHASREFNSIEINGTHYSLQKPDTFKKWAEQTPEHFIFSIKGSRYITHLKRLKDIETPLANFFASGVLALGKKLGPFLWQLPPSLKFDGERIARFLRLLPHNTRAASRLSKKHDDKIANRAWTKPGGNRPFEALPGGMRLRQRIPACWK
jgi:uncharacterized protein YecE (DUF72 family)